MHEIKYYCAICHRKAVQNKNREIIRECNHKGALFVEVVSNFDEAEPPMQELPSHTLDAQ